MINKKKEPAISVVITTKNRIEELKKAINSVFDQTFDDYELIVVDDGSEDGTSGFLQSMGKKYNFFRHIQLEKSDNRSGNYARNVGVQVAKASVIAMLDDDDYWFPSKLEKQYNILKDKKDTDFVYCGVRRIINQKYQLDKKAVYKGDLSSEILKKMVCLTSTMMYRKSLWKKVGGFDQSISHWQDYEFTIRAFQCTKVACISEPLVGITVNTKKKSRLSNQYISWENSVRIIKEKHTKLINSKKDVDLRDFENLILEDGANRLYLNGEHLKYQKKMIFLGKRTKNLKYVIRGVFCISSNLIQSVKGKKINK